MEGRGRRQGFTLVELLVVIAIIGILIALVMGSVSLAMNKAKKAQGVVTAKALTTAIQGYNDEYPQLGWPNRLGSLNSESQGFGYIRDNLYKVLVGKDMGAALESYNPRQVEFYTPSAQSARVGPDIDSGIVGLLDPWGRLYRFSIDLNDDGVTTVRDGYGTYEVPGTRVVAWSVGKDGKDGTVKEARDNVRTWRYTPPVGP